MNKTIATRLLLIVSLGLIALSAACNTVSGAGEDLQEASENTKEAFSK
jgi:predicted small secreted protein